MTIVHRTLGALVAATMLIPSAAAQKRPSPGRPSNVPVNAQSAFDPALSCMDELLSRSSSAGSGFYLIPAGIDDPDGKGGFTRDMIIGAATKMSQRSHFFTIAFDPDNLPENRKGGFLRTAGSLTGLDQQVSTKDGGGGLSIASVIGANATNRTGISNLTVSFYLLDANQQLIDGTFSSATLTLESKSKARLVSGALSFLGGSLSMSSSETDGLHAGVKALIDLAMIQAVGSFIQVPYAQCLAAVGSADTRAALWDEYRKMKPPAQREAIVAAMVRRGLAPANPTPVQLRQAIAAFERSQGLPPSGEIRFELFEKLRQIDTTPAPMNRPATGRPAVHVAGAPGPFRYNTGDLPRVAATDKLAFQVTVAEPAYVACYYADADGKVTRLFPNPGRPAYRLAPGEVLRMPGDQDPYVIRGQTRGVTEWVTCLAASDDFLPRIAHAVPDAAFTPLDRFDGPDALIRAATGADPNLSVDTLTYIVE